MARKFLIAFLSLLLLLVASAGVIHFTFPAYSHYYLGVCCAQSNDKDSAKGFFESSIALSAEQSSPSSTTGSAYIGLGVTCLHTKEIDKSQECFEKALAIFSEETVDRADCLALLGMIQMIKEGHPHSESIIKAVKSFPLIPSSKKKNVYIWIISNYYFDYQRHLDQGKQELASHALEKSVRLIDCLPEDSDYIDIYRSFAIALEEKKDFDRAEAYYKKALKSTDINSSDYYLLHSDLGTCYAEHERYEKSFEHTAIAMAYYERENDLRGKTDVYNSLAWRHYKMGHKEESLHYALKALEGLSVTSDQFALLDTVACAYKLNEDYANAEKYIKAAIQEMSARRLKDNKSLAKSYTFLGDVAWTQGKWHEANLAWEVAGE